MSTIVLFRYLIRLPPQSWHLPFNHSEQQSHSKGEHIYSLCLCVCISLCLYFFFHSFVFSVYLSACLPVCLSACQPVSLPACLPVCLSACLPVCLSACQSTSLSVFQFVCLKICLFNHPVVHLSVNLPGYPRACQSVCEPDSLSVWPQGILVTLTKLVNFPWIVRMPNKVLLNILSHLSNFKNLYILLRQRGPYNKHFLVEIYSYE
jgi:hypothetical protein